MSERERELIATIWFFAVACVALLIVLSINFWGDREGRVDERNIPFKYPVTDSCDSPNPPSPCLENVP